MLIGRNNPEYKAKDDYYTPPSVFERLGLHFDLDVCAPEGGLDWIPAKKHYSLKENGLIQRWFGRVWCNPPYSASKLWVEKFIDHNNGVMLVQIAKSKTFEKIWASVDGIVPLFENIKFIDIEGKKKGIFMPTMLIAMGKENCDAIAKFNRVR